MYSALYRVDGGYPFGPIIDKCVSVVSPEDLNKAGPGFLVLWGGEDISPELYNARSHFRTGAGGQASRRDKLEANLARAAIAQGMLIVGICRGAQLMCALSGGKLIQHCFKHAGPDHRIYTDKDEVYITSSLHHQMMYPYGIDHQMIAWTCPAISQVHYLEDEFPIKMPAEAYNTLGQLCEPEIVYFPKTKALCIQGHPEYMEQDHPFVVYCNSLVKEYVGQP